jgi:hypothetical protein
VQLDATIRTESTLIVFPIVELEVVDEVVLDVLVLVELLVFSSPVISTSWLRCGRSSELLPSSM